MTTFLGEAALRQVSLRVTKQRMAVLAAVRRHAHGTVEDIAGDVRRELGGVSIQTVYDVLHVLADAGLVRSVEPAGSPARYDARVGDNHHHLVCRNCGAMVDVDCAVGTAPCLKPSDRQGFVIDEAEVTYWGECPDCRSS